LIGRQRGGKRDGARFIVAQRDATAAYVLALDTGKS
jgi:hypothetical protein